MPSTVEWMEMDFLHLHSESGSAIIALDERRCAMTKQRKILLGFTLLYAAMMIYLLFFRAPAFTDEPYREQLHDHLNHIPFRTIGLYLRLFRPPCRSWLVRLAVVNLSKGRRGSFSTQ